jgi:hypothetical protein
MSASDSEMLMANEELPQEDSKSLDSNDGKEEENDANEVDMDSVDNNDNESVNSNEDRKGGSDVLKPPTRSRRRPTRQAVINKTYNEPLFDEEIDDDVDSRGDDVDDKEEMELKMQRQMETLQRLKEIEQQFEENKGII